MYMKYETLHYDEWAEIRFFKIVRYYFSNARFFFERKIVILECTTMISKKSEGEVMAM